MGKLTTWTIENPKGRTWSATTDQSRCTERGRIASCIRHATDHRAETDCKKSHMDSDVRIAPFSPFIGIFATPGVVSGKIRSPLAVDGFLNVPRASPHTRHVPIVPNGASFYNLGVEFNFILGRWRLAFAKLCFLRKASVLLEESAGQSDPARVDVDRVALIPRTCIGNSRRLNRI